MIYINETALKNVNCLKILSLSPISDTFLRVITTVSANPAALAYLLAFSAKCFLQFFQKQRGLSAIHLNMVKLEGDGKRRSVLMAPIFAPCQERVVEDAAVLIDDAVKFCRHHGRCANHHRIVQKGTLARGVGCLSQSQIVRIKLF